jgi:hypothetical protein
MATDSSDTVSVVPDPRCPLRTPAAALLLAAAAAAARAEGPVGPAPGEGDPRAEIERISRKITKDLRENEEALTRVARGEEGDPGRVDVEIPPDPSAPPKGKPESPPAGGAPSGGAPSGGSPTGGGGTLRGSAEKGREITRSIDELLLQAARMAQPGGSGGGSSRGEKEAPSEGKQRSEKRGPEGKKDDPSSASGGDDPKHGEKDPSRPSKKGAVPPSDPKQPPDPRDAKGVFLAKLPDKVREAVLNGDFDQVPERYRDLIREWTKTLAEKEPVGPGESPADGK